MKALTVCQPYASLIALPESDPRHKRVENRTWHAPREIIGQTIAIHAGKSLKYLDLSPDRSRDEEYNMLMRDMPLGAVIATAKLVASPSIEDVLLGKFDEQFPWLRTHQHTHGPFCLVLQDVRKLERPVFCGGALGWWNWAPAAEVARD